jgi:molecular chaperone GrpE
MRRRQGLAEDQDTVKTPQPDEDTPEQDNEQTAQSETETQDASAADVGGEASTSEEQAPAAESESESALEQEIADLKNQLLRVHADFDNFRRRTRQEREDLQKFATKSVITDLLGVVDNFERALSSLPSDDATSDVRKGVEMVHRQLVTVLEKYGVQAMDAVGQPFDPTLHEAVMQEPAADGQAPGTVVQELQKGYTMHGKVLRPAMVKVTV